MTDVGRSRCRARHDAGHAIGPSTSQKRRFIKRSRVFRVNVPITRSHGSTLREQSSSCRWAIDRIELRFSNLDRPARG
eukprot:3098158-Pyramimonas_sp.AAC.1